jgi:LysR family glycine cleavage system transcriptional activator
MKRQLPSFPSLRAFESAARQLSFKAAANELCVTQSAISHQVKILEEFLEAPLFIRHPQSVELTLRGSEYFGMVTFLLDGIESATRKIKGNEMEGALFVQSTPAFTSYWLLPRLIRFNKLYPNIEVNLYTIATPDAPADHPYDLRINCPWNVPPGKGGEPLMETPHVPVCIPEILKDGVELQSVEELLQYPVVKMAPPWTVWRRWFEENGVADLSRVSGPVMENIYLALKAAEEGQGIAFAPLAFIQESLATGRLIIALDIPTKSPSLYFTLSCSTGWQNNPRILAFREWLNDELGSCSGMDMHYRNKVQSR